MENFGIFNFIVTCIGLPEKKLAETNEETETDKS